MNIVVLEPLGVAETKLRPLAATLEKQGHTCTYYSSRTDKTTELIARLHDAHIVILSNQPLRKEVLEHCPQLQLISVAFTGVDHIDMAYCQQRGIVVSNAAGYSTHGVAELVFGLCLSVLRHIVVFDQATREQGTMQGRLGGELYGKTFGIIGTGAIGLRVAELAKAFGCRVLAYSRSKKQTASELGLEYVGLEMLLRESDVVSLHVPLYEGTRHLINADRLALMKPEAVLINTARGPVVDSVALAAALKEGRLAGAGIDVFDTEPPIDAEQPLLHAPNAVLTPHVAFATKEALYTRAEIVFRNIEQWLNGTPQNIVSGR